MKVTKQSDLLIDYNAMYLSISGYTIFPSLSARNLGVTFW